MDDGPLLKALKDVGERRSSASITTVLSAFVPTLLTAVLSIAIFTVVRHRFPKIYAPRTFIKTIPEKNHTPTPSRSSFDWAKTLWEVPDKFVLYHESLDAHLYLRFLRTLIFICVVGCCLTWPVLFPVNATGGGSQLDRLTIGNIRSKHQLYFHAGMAWIFFAFVLFTVARERLWLVGLRQAWANSRANAERLSSRTVLFLSAPKDALKPDNMQKYFGSDAVRIWPATKAQRLERLISERSAKIELLEAAEMSFIQAVNRKGGKGKHTVGGEENVLAYESLSADLIKSCRPTHVSKAPPIGKRVDSIDWYRSKIQELEARITEAREEYESEDSHDQAAVFVEFKSLRSAQAAFQQVQTPGLLTLTPKYTGVLPEEVNWSNLALSSERRISQHGIAVALVVATIMFWFIPLAVVGAVSNVSFLAEHYKWLDFLNKLPDAVIGLLSGLVPPLLVGMLTRYVPNIFRYILTRLGEPTNTSAELLVQKWFYVFQVVNVFLVTAVASGSAAAIPQLAERATKDPTSVPTILARNLPTSSNFYLTYFVVQGLTRSADNLLNYSDLLSYLFYDYFFDKTPRQKFRSFTSLRGIAWGKVFPKYTNFVIIAIAYSCIAPLVLGFAAAGLSMLYLSYRYMLLYTVQPKIDTKGHCYTVALQQILTGVYIAELSLIGICGLRSATGPSILLALLFVTTVISHRLMDKYLAPLEKYLPTELDHWAENDEQTPLLASAEEGRASALATQAFPSIGSKVVDPIQRFFQPHISASYKSIKAWLEDGDLDALDVPRYDEEEVKTAYLNPALRSKTPVVWLARDDMGVSKSEVSANEEKGLKATDKGAWVDGKGRVRWNERDFDEVPVFKEQIRW